MTDGITLSVVIPFYNGVDNAVVLVEQLESDDTRYEIVLVNDGSTECSAEKLAARFEAFANVRLVSYDGNRGVSAARNVGIQAARGNYIWMVDSDDLVARNGIARVVEWIEGMQGGFDVLFFSWTYELSGLDNQPIQAIELSKDDALRLVYERDGYVWDKIFCRQTMIDYGICFDDQLFWAEDKLFCAQFLAVSVGGRFLTPSQLYCHKKNGASFTSSRSADKKRLTLIDSKLKLLELAKRLQNEELVGIAQVDLVSDALMLLFRLVKCRPNGWRGYWKKYWGMISPYKKDYSKSRMLSFKYRMFLGFCPFIDFVLCKSREGAA